jgi:hypothetical protein
MLTLQKLLNFVKRQGLDPGEVTVVLRRPCATGDDQIDFLVEPRIIKNSKALSLDDKWLPIPLGLTLAILEEDEIPDEVDASPGPFDDVLKRLRESTNKGFTGLPAPEDLEELT